MLLNKQVCTELQGERLKELGVIQESMFYDTHSEKWGIMPKRSVDFTGNPTALFNVAELGQILGLSCDGILEQEQYETEQFCTWFEAEISKHTTEASLRAAVLIYSIEQNIITLAEVNNRISK